MKKIIGTNASEELFGSENNDAIIAKKGNDYLVGYGGDDYLDGGDGIDFLMPGLGNDTVVGGAGDDALFDNDGGNDVYYPGPGNDDTRDQIGKNVFVFEKELQSGFGNDFLDQGSVFDDKIIFKGYKSTDVELVQNQFQTTFYFNDGSSLLVNGAGTESGVNLLEGRDYFFETRRGPICGF
ncbi:calcium-binding protein [Azospirillum sp. INR13]|uniref:calcium-binding protein n=1 Tax=Azospirillum sp. INR13 TaxID=2596919 RepID=UPI00189271A2|nr:calcium-binding protein [Azospirillum sp. INR13]MBF5096205.1 calcium-binding protein [Azospirillum sp. INR13]